MNGKRITPEIIELAKDTRAERIERERKYNREYSRKWVAKNKEKHRQYVDNWREKNPDKLKHKRRNEKQKKQHREYMSLYRKLYPERIKETRRRWYQKNKKKKLVHRKVEDAIKLGRIIRPETCSICYGRNGKIEAHHEGYSKPFEIIWVCRSCHANIHR